MLIGSMPSMEFTYERLSLNFFLDLSIQTSAKEYQCEYCIGIVKDCIEIKNDIMRNLCSTYLSGFRKEKVDVREYFDTKKDYHTFS
ncbi:hypothetical protein QTP88_024065 [Uroleucon formosanum]